jgi:hypothetical protein
MKTRGWPPVVSRGCQVHYIPNPPPRTGLYPIHKLEEGLVVRVPVKHSVSNGPVVSWRDGL